MCIYTVKKQKLKINKKILKGGAQTTEKNLNFFFSIFL